MSLRAHGRLRPDQPPCPARLQKETGHDNHAVGAGLVKLPELLAGEEEKTRWTSQTRPEGALGVHGRPKGLFHIVCCVTPSLFPTLPPPPTRNRKTSSSPLASSSSLGPPRSCSFSCLVPSRSKKKNACPASAHPGTKKSCAPVSNPQNQRRQVYSFVPLSKTINKTGGRPPQYGCGRGVGAQHHQQQQPLGHPQG